MTPTPIPPPLRRRKPAAAPPPAFTPFRTRLLNYVLGFVTLVLVVDALVGDRGLLDTMRARRQFSELSVSLAQKRHENARLRETTPDKNVPSSRPETWARWLSFTNSPSNSPRR